ncbi:MAG: hypothetical protein KAS32_00770 [Candidatus Peribacteraceae bacterium]|nr:hypothetical protein [Candidatus Peribacteraceae bacterium]
MRYVGSNMLTPAMTNPVTVNLSGHLTGVHIRGDDPTMFCLDAYLTDKDDVRIHDLLIRADGSKIVGANYVVGCCLHEPILITGIPERFNGIQAKHLVVIFHNIDAINNRHGSLVWVEV